MTDASAGKLSVRVTVARDCDPDQVRAVLAATARGLSHLAPTPEPFVALEDFGARGLEFSVSGLLAPGARDTEAASALRIAILKAFRAAGIELPRPQIDVHLRDLDGLRLALARFAEARAARDQDAE